jgi:hypothetical protein
MTAGSFMKAPKSIPLFLFAFLASGIINFSHAQVAEEYRVKAAFIYNFAKFIDWPGAAFPKEDSPLLICLLGEDPILEHLKSLEEKPLGQRKVQVKVAKSLEAIEGCHIVFIAASEKARMPQILRKAAPYSTLTVGDAEGFLESGGMIQFSLVEGKIRFSINLANARLAGLQMSSKLMKLAEKVLE